MSAQPRCDGCGAKHTTWVKRSLVNHLVWVVVTPGAMGSRFYTPGHIVDVNAANGLCRQCADRTPPTPTTQGSLW